MPEITVILPTHSRNKNGLLAKSIESVLNQDADFELFIIDDGSIDGSKDTIEYYADLDPRVSFHRFNRNVGLPAATTVHAYNNSDSKFIAWQFDDSYWTDNHLSSLSKAASELPNNTIVYGKARAYRGSNPIEFSEKIDKNRMLAGDNHLAQGATLVPRVIHEKIGWYDPSIILKRFNDMDFWRRCVIANVDFYQIDDFLHTDTGGSLHDSLGNSVDNNTKLVTDYIQYDRNKLLLPSKISSFSKFFIPPDLKLSVDMRSFLIKLIFDHQMKIGETGLDCLRMEPYISEILIEAQMEKTDLVSWWASNTLSHVAKLKLRELELLGIVLDKQAFIDQQQAYIDQQQAYIDNSLRPKN